MAKAKYQTPEYKTAKRQGQRDIDAGNGWCREIICLETSRYIPPGTKSDQWHVAHDHTGTIILGPAHARCNTADGGRRRHKPVIPKRLAL